MYLELLFIDNSRERAPEGNQAARLEKTRRAGLPYDNFVEVLGRRLRLRLRGAGSGLRSRQPARK